MTTVNILLQHKGHDVWSIAPDASVYEAIHLLAEKEIGALMVIEDDKLVGVISERDYARQIILKERSSRDTLVREIMSTTVVYGKPRDKVADCMSLMTERKIRHLPVMDGDRLVGVISLGDLVRHIIAEQKTTINELERYIHG